MTKCGRFPAQFVHQPDHRRTVEDFAEKQDCGALGSGQLVLHFGKLRRGCVPASVGREHGRGSTHAVLCACLGFEEPMAASDVDREACQIVAAKRSVTVSCLQWTGQCTITTISDGLSVVP